MLSLGLFFSTALLHPGDYYGSDILLSFPLLLQNVPAGYQIKNSGIGDSVTVFHPFFYQNLAQFRQGTFPLWDPYIGMGAPHLGNLQSAIFSPATLPFYFLSWQAALLVSAFLKLFLSGFFTYLFLRQLRLGFWPAIFGATGFMYCGFNIYWLANTAPAVTPMLPMALYFIEKSLQTAGRQRFGWLAGITASVALGIFAGHAETFFFIALFLAVYVLIRLLARRAGWKERGWLLVQLGFFGGAGLLLSAVQLLPFYEYLSNSYAYLLRTDFSPTPLPPPAWLLNIFPNIFGNPANPYNAIYKLTVNTAPQNLPEANGAYVGAIAVFLTGAAFFYLKKFPLAGLFAGGAVLGMAYQYNLFDLVRFSQALPMLNRAQPNRVQPVIAFCLSAAAAYGLEGLASTRPGWKKAALIAGSGLISGALALALVPAAWNLIPLDTQEPAFKAYMPVQLAYITGMFVVGVAGLVLISLPWPKPGTRTGLRLAGLVLAAGVLFSESGWLLHNFNPTVPAFAYRPQSPTIQAVQRTVGENNLLMMKNHEIRADVSAFYNLRIPGSYDGLGINSYYRLYTTLFHTAPEGDYPAEIDPQVLKLLGMNYVANGQAPGSRVEEKAPDPDYWSEPLLEGQRIVQTFVPAGNNLNQVDMKFVSFERKNRCSVQIVLFAAWDSNREVGRQELSCENILNGFYEPLAFLPEKESAGKAYRLEIYTRGTGQKNFVGLPLSTKRVPREWHLTIANPQGQDTGRAATLDYQLHYGATADFKWAYGDNLLSIFQFTASPGRYWTVGKAAEAANEENALKIVVQDRPDPLETVVLTGRPIEGLAGEAGPVQTVAEKADRINLHINRKSPGYLVAAISYFPGWKAKVNGQEVRLEKGNYTFMAVPVPGGESQVELLYDPLSFKLGAFLSLATLLCLVALVAWQWRWPGPIPARKKDEGLEEEVPEPSVQGR